MSPQQIGNAGLTQFEAVTAAATSATQGFWAITTEATGYSQKSVANIIALGEKLSRARKLDEIIQLNSDFARTAFDDFTTEVTKIGSIYADMANQTMRVAKAGFNARPLEEAPVNPLKPAASRKQDTVAANSI
ncbi:phasin family protein [Methylocystis bryophila]|nr:phasin family protein [Methylocystis bryophila]